MSNLGLLHTAPEEPSSTKKSGSRRRPKFRTELFGYAKSEVRTYISRLQSDVEQSREWADSVARDLEQSRRAVESHSGPQTTDKAPHPPKAVAHVVERTLASAHRLAEEIRQEAQREADEIVAGARTRATRIVEEANATAGATHESAMVRLKEVEQNIALMKQRHREVSGSLESMLNALGQTLTEVRSRRTLEDTTPPHADNERAHEAIEVVVRAAAVNAAVGNAPAVLPPAVLPSAVLPSAVKKMIASRVERVT